MTEPTKAAEADASESQRFIMLCLPKREATYIDSIAASEQDVLFCATAEIALRECIMNPPLGLIVDMVTGMRLGSNNPTLLAIYNLEIRWPILRATAKRNEDPTLISTESQRNIGFAEGLREIAAGSSNWEGGKSPRNFIRQEINCRVRVRHTGQEDWALGTALEMSAGGCFMVTYSPMELGADLDVEVRDVASEPLHLSAKVAWRRTWEDSVKLPGMALKFDRSTVPESLASGLAELFCGVHKD